MAFTRGRAGWVRAVAGATTVALGIVVVSVIGEVVNAVAAPSPLRHWAWTELNLWIIALGALGLAVVLRGRDAARS